MNFFSQLSRVRNFSKCIIWNTRQSERCFHISQYHRKQVLTKTLRIKHEDFYRQIDRVPQQYEMIYKMPFHYTLNFGKAVVIIASSVVPLTWMYNKFYQISGDVIHFIGTAAASNDDLLWFGGFLMLTNIFIYRTCHIIALRIYRHEKSYIAIIPGIIPRLNSQVHFQEGQVKEHFKAISFFRGVTYKANGKTMLLIPERFRKSKDLFDMLDKSDAKKYKQISK